MPLALTLIAVLTLIVFAALVIRQQNLRLRQMRHQERVAALEAAARGGQTPDGEGDLEMSESITQATTPTDAAAQWKDPATYTHWFRVSTLGLAFLLMFGGIGMLVAFIIIPDREMQRMWSLGLIPIMAGFGLLLFSLLSSYLIRDKTKDD